MNKRLAIALMAIVVFGGLVLLGLYLWLRQHPQTENQSSAAISSDPTPATMVGKLPASGYAPTNIYAHNLMLRKGPDFRIYVRWLRGQMVRTKHDVNPSFDEPESFTLEIKTGVIRANIGDIGHYLSSTGDTGPLKNISLLADGDQIKLQGTLHKLISIPIELRGSLSVVPDNKIQVHVTKLSALKIPLKGLLGAFHIEVADLFHSNAIPGVQVKDNDIIFDTQTLLPPPHIRGQLKTVRVVSPDIEEIYGSAQDDVSRVEQWRNFLRLRDGTVDFGRLTMSPVDLVMIDLSDDAWFDLDLTNYQEQLVNGYTRMTPQAGLQIFMPDLDDLRKKQPTQNVSVEWMKNRKLPPPADVIQK